MATAVQTGHAVAPTGTTIIPGAGNDEIEDSNAHGNNNSSNSMVTGLGGGSGKGQDSMDDSSMRFLLVDRTDDDFDFL